MEIYHVASTSYSEKQLFSINSSENHPLNKSLQTTLKFCENSVSNEKSYCNKFWSVLCCPLVSIWNFITWLCCCCCCTSKTDPFLEIQNDPGLFEKACEANREKEEDKLTDFYISNPEKAEESIQRLLDSFKENITVSNLVSVLFIVKNLRVMINAGLKRALEIRKDDEKVHEALIFYLLKSLGNNSSEK